MAIPRGAFPILPALCCQAWRANPWSLRLIWRAWLARRARPASFGRVVPRHVLTAVGLTPAQARASLRFSVGCTNTQEEIDKALELISAAVTRQRDAAA